MREFPVKVWAWVKGEWRPALWVRTIERGRKRGWYECLVGHERRKRWVHPDHVRERKSA